MGRGASLNPFDGCLWLLIGLVDGDIVPNGLTGDLADRSEDCMVMIESQSDGPKAEKVREEVENALALT